DDAGQPGLLADHGALSAARLEAAVRAAHQLVALARRYLEAEREQLAVRAALEAIAMARPRAPEVEVGLELAHDQGDGGGRDAVPGQRAEQRVAGAQAVLHHGGRRVRP